MQVRCKSNASQTRRIFMCKKRFKEIFLKKSENTIDFPRIPWYTQLQKGTGERPRKERTVPNHDD